MCSVKALTAVIGAIVLIWTVNLENHFSRCQLTPGEGADLIDTFDTRDPPAYWGQWQDPSLGNYTSLWVHLLDGEPLLKDALSAQPPPLLQGDGGYIYIWSYWYTPARYRTGELILLAGAKVAITYWNSAPTNTSRQSSLLLNTILLDSQVNNINVVWTAPNPTGPSMGWRTVVVDLQVTQPTRLLLELQGSKINTNVTGLALTKIAIKNGFYISTPSTPSTPTTPGTAGPGSTATPPPAPATDFQTSPIIFTLSTSTAVAAVTTSTPTTSLPNTISPTTTTPGQPAPTGEPSTSSTESPGYSSSQTPPDVDTNSSATTTTAAATTTNSESMTSTTNEAITTSAQSQSPNTQSTSTVTISPSVTSSSTATPLLPTATSQSSDASSSPSATSIVTAAESTTAAPSALTTPQSVLVGIVSFVGCLLIILFFVLLGLWLRRRRRNRPILLVEDDASSDTKSNFSEPHASLPTLNVSKFIIPPVSVPVEPSLPPPPPSPSSLPSTPAVVRSISPPLPPPPSSGRRFVLSQTPKSDQTFQLSLNEI